MKDSSDRHFSPSQLLQPDISPGKGRVHIPGCELLFLDLAEKGVLDFP